MALAQTGYVSFGIAVDRDIDPAVLLTVIQGQARCWPRSCVPPLTKCAWHRFGLASAEAFATMGSWDIGAHPGIATDWTGPATVTMRQIPADPFAQGGDSGSSARW